MSEKTGLRSRLEEIDTPWTQLGEAHQDYDLSKSQDAQSAILYRYSVAIESYLQAVAQDKLIAQELAQEFAVRFLRGDFKRVDRQSGKFRSYLKRALHNLVIDYFRKQQRRANLVQRVWNDKTRQQSSLQAEMREGVDVDHFWRNEILRLAWNEFRKENEDSDTPYFEILHLRTAHPEASLSELATLLHARQPRSVGTLRKTLSRARKRFSEILRQEVARSCGSFEDQHIEQELCDLGLRKYFRRPLRK